VPYDDPEGAADLPPLPLEAWAFRRRALLVDAAVREIADRGYARTTAASISARAGLPSDAFHAVFPAKEDALLHAYDVAIAFTAPRIFAAIRAARGWQQAAVAALATYLTILDCDHAWALVCLQETAAAGERVRQARDTLRAPIVEALGQLPEDAEDASVDMSAVVSALDAIAIDGLRHRPDQPLAARRRELARFVLAPFTDGPVPDEIEPPRVVPRPARGRIEALIAQGDDAGPALLLLVRAAVTRRDGPTLWRTIVALQRRRAQGHAVDEEVVETALDGIRDAWFFGLATSGEAAAQCARG
jgi:AcrR family transcriptional regulator